MGMGKRSPRLLRNTFGCLDVGYGIPYPVAMGTHSFAVVHKDVAGLDGEIFVFVL